MKIILCDNCGERGNEMRSGDLCEQCMEIWLIESEKTDKTKRALDEELKRKFRIK